MGAVWQLAGSEIRRRWRSVVVLVLLVGIVGAIVLATAAGARRTSSALGRFNSSSRAATVQLQVPAATAAQLRAFGQVPEVSSFGVASGMYRQDPSAPNLTIIAEQDTKIGTVVDRARVMAGRAANPTAVDEVAIDESVAAQIHRGIGDHLDISSYSPKQIAVALQGGNPGGAAGPRVRLGIVGIIRRPFDLGRRGVTGGITILTPAFYHAYAGRIGIYPVLSVRVRTRNGLPDIPQIKAAALRIFGPSPNLSVTDPATEAGGAQDAIDVLTIALWILAGVVAVAGAVAIGIVLTREVALPSFDQETLRALGLTRSQRRAISAPRTFLVAAGGALVAALGAAAASGLFPIGVARIAEPTPGLRIDWPVLTLGFVAVAATVFAIAFVATVRGTHAERAEADAPISRRT
ncbi:MAG TPA: FtsX-like permease family protein, partial [Acidimicrobiia bacterium]|nr:FtsX-like permease family protein [Acidimicrobiia bacterium]